MSKGLADPAALPSSALDLAEVEIPTPSIDSSREKGSIKTQGTPGARTEPDLRYPPTRASRKREIEAAVSEAQDSPRKRRRLDAINKSAPQPATQVLTTQPPPRDRHPSPEILPQLAIASSSLDASGSIPNPALQASNLLFGRSPSKSQAQSGFMSNPYSQLSVDSVTATSTLEFNPSSDSAPADDPFDFEEIRGKYRIIQKIGEGITSFNINRSVSLILF